MKEILLVEDDSDLGNILRQFLNASGFSVEWKTNGNEALDHLKQTPVAACILDVMMPLMDGFTLAEKIINLHPGTPFIFLTAKKTKDDRLRGLGLGADDYIVKPFEVDELILRLKNILKRTEHNYSNTDILSINSYKLDSNRLILQHEAKTIRLTETEAKLLRYLFFNRNKMIKRKDILVEIWGRDDYFIGRSLDVFLTRIRKYLQNDNSISIVSVRNVGIEFKVTSGE
jgi:DNA-binding response OmpR family regulator